MTKFISCDWGTSALRLWLVDANTLNVLAEAASINGISATFESWKKSGAQETGRLFFYQSLLSEQIKGLESQLNLSLDNIPIVISGMASSSIGMIELPYKEIPFSADGHNLNTEIVEATPEFNHAILMISGAKTTDDAMRGEETQLVGCLKENATEERLFIFPGTHSKHIIIKDGEVVSIKTYMTGEFFYLLSKKSILSNDVEEDQQLTDATNTKGFTQGVSDSQHSSLLHSSFRVRTNNLFKKLSKKENYYYLSGLLIGTELKELIGVKVPITIIGEESLIKYYSIALAQLGLHGIRYQDAAKAVINGHYKLLSLYQSKLKLATASLKNK